MFDKDINRSYFAVEWLVVQGPMSIRDRDLSFFFTSLLKGNSLYEVAHTFAHAQLASLASSAMLRSAHLFVSSLTRYLPYSA